MKDLKDCLSIPIPHVKQNTKDVLFEAIRKVISDCVRAGFVPKDMTEKQARHFAYEMTLILLDMLKSGNPRDEKFAERYLSLLERYEGNCEVVQDRKPHPES